MSKEEAYDLARRTQDAIRAAAAYAGRSGNMRLYESLRRLGREAMAGMSKGMAEGDYEAVSQIAKNTERVIDAARGKLQARSPSQVFRRLFRTVGQGIAAGIDDERERVPSTMRRLTKDMRREAEREHRFGVNLRGRVSGEVSERALWRRMEMSRPFYTRQLGEARPEKIRSEVVEKKTHEVVLKVRGEGGDAAGINIYQIAGAVHGLIEKDLKGGR